MNRIVTTLIGLGLLIIVAICGLNMLGLNDVVRSAGDKIRGGAAPQAAQGAEPAGNGMDEFAQKALGWDIRDISKKPVATVKEGLAKLEAKIDELERQKEQARAADRKASKRSEEFEKELAARRQALVETREILLNQETKYPIRINTTLYSSREMLKESYDREKAKYESMKNSSTFEVNNSVRTAKIVMNIEGQIRTARSMKDLLVAKLAWAESQELGDAVEANDPVMKELESRAGAIFSDPVDLPVGPASESDRIEKELLEEID